MLTKKIFYLLGCVGMIEASIFSIKVEDTTKGTSFSKEYSTVTDVIDTLDTKSIEQEINYNPTDALNASVDYRGLPIVFKYIENTTTLVMDIPSIGVSETFTGATRNASADSLEDWFKKDGAEAIEKMMKKLAEVSPVDPVAGNPDSAMSKSVASDFQVGFTNVATKQSTLAQSTSTNNANNILVAPSYSSLDIDGLESSSYSLPLGYSFNFDRDSREKITVGLPVSYIDVEGSKAISLGLNLAYTKPVNEKWILTSAMGYGVNGSVDFGSVAQIASASLTSSYSIDLADDYTLSIGNMVGYYTTVKFYSGDYTYNPGITNVVYRNALMLNIPTNELINNTSVETFVIDTRYTGSALFMESYQEYGLSYGYDAVNFNIFNDDEKYAVRKTFKIGMSYLTSAKANGYKVNLGFLF